MSITACLLLAAAATAPKVDVATLQGQTHAGTLERITATTLTLETETDPVHVPVAELMEVRFPATEKPAEGEKLAAWVALTDGTRLSCTKVTTTAKAASIEPAGLGSLEVPMSAVAHVRFGPPDPKVDEAWDKLCRREATKDLLVIRKNDVLDFLDGQVGSVDETFVKFLLDGAEVPVNRAKVFGVIYARRAAQASKPFCSVALAGGDTVFVKALTWDGSKLKAALPAGAELDIPVESVRSLDFSLGKIRYLSQMDPRDEEHVPFFGAPDVPIFRYRRDKTIEGKPLKLGGKAYDRGLWIHSKTRLQYRIGGEYRRFQAVMGIDQEVAHGEGAVRVVISGDGRKLLETDVRAADPPQPLDLDVTGVRDLEILVDFIDEKDAGIADWLDLADARIIK